MEKQRAPWISAPTRHNSHKDRTLHLLCRVWQFSGWEHLVGWNTIFNYLCELSGGGWWWRHSCPNPGRWYVPLNTFSQRFPQHHTNLGLRRYSPRFSHGIRTGYLLNWPRWQTPWRCVSPILNIPSKIWFVGLDPSTTIPPRSMWFLIHWWVGDFVFQFLKNSIALLCLTWWLFCF